MGCPKGPGPSTGGEVPHHFYFMKELSIFIDESGDFSTKASNDKAYLVSFILHDQSIDISDDLKKLESKVKNTVG